MNEPTKHILLVEDEPAHAQMVCRAFEKHEDGYRITVAGSLTQARDYLARFSPDLVITDMTMPNMTGLELSKELMRIRQDIPIILCTGFSEHISAETAKKAGIRKFLMKPLTIKDLAFAVRKLIDKKSKT